MGVSSYKWISSKEHSL